MYEIRLPLDFEVDETAPSIDEQLEAADHFKEFVEATQDTFPIASMPQAQRPNADPPLPHLRSLWVVNTEVPFRDQEVVLKSRVDHNGTVTGHEVAYRLGSSGSGINANYGVYGTAEPAVESHFSSYDNSTRMMRSVIEGLKGLAAGNAERPNELKREPRKIILPKGALMGLVAVQNLTASLAEVIHDANKLENGIQIMSTDDHIAYTDGAV